LANNFMVNWKIRPSSYVFSLRKNLTDPEIRFSEVDWLSKFLLFKDH
jgi:hypothetical protein